MNHSEIVSFLWGVADLIRDTFKRGKYQDVILPLTVLRRLDCVLAPTRKRRCSKRRPSCDKEAREPRPQLRKVVGLRVLQHLALRLREAPRRRAPPRRQPPQLHRRLQPEHARGAREVRLRQHHQPSSTRRGCSSRWSSASRTSTCIPDKVDNPTMGTVFEELIRKFNEALDENPGEHFTPRDVVHLMVDLMLAGDETRDPREEGDRGTVYDPCCGSGGMLTITKEHITVGLRKNGDVLRPAINQDADIHLFGQEVNPETWAVSKSDLFMKDPTVATPTTSPFGSTLSNDRHAGQTFDYLIANPPYGKDWKRDEDAVRAEHERGVAGRFAPGLPRISDGQLLFLLHMLAHAKDAEGGRLTHRDHHERLAALHRRRRQRRERDPPLHPRERSARGPDRAAGAALLQHRHRTYVWVVTNRKAPDAQGQGAAHRRDLVLDADAQEPRRQAARDPARAASQDILGFCRLQGRRDTDRDRRTQQKKLSSANLPDHALRLPQDHRRAPAAAELPGQPGADRAPRGGERVSRSRAVEEEGRRRGEGAGGRARASRRRSASCCDAARRALQGPRRVRALSSTRAARRPASSCRRRQKGDPLRPLASATRRPPSAATRTATPSPTPNCATPRACRSRRASRRSSSAR